MTHSPAPTDRPDVSGGTHVSDVQSEEIIKRYLQSYSSFSWNIVDLLLRLFLNCRLEARETAGWCWRRQERQFEFESV